jgi:DeoR/GlpR family transcriptional regulator of sugar metabolism
LLKKERHAFIMHQLNLHNKVLSNDLCNRMEVSEDTIRRDLQELASEEKLIKVHGGALSLSFNDIHFTPDHLYSAENKKTIAEKAVSLIKDGMFILTGGGTTIVEMARNLPSKLKATFITGSIPAINEYLKHPSIEVVVIGDRILKDSKITTGSEAISKIRQINADFCFLGINALDIQHGVTENDWNIVQLKKEMINAASKTVCLTISEKLNSFHPLQICGVKQIDYLVTELDPSHEKLKPYKDAGIHIL